MARLTSHKPGSTVLMLNPAGIHRLLIAVIMYGTLVSPVAAQDSSNSVMDGTDCTPKINFTTPLGSIPICLASYIPENDSCAEVDLIFPTFGVQISFYLDVDRHWKYTKTVIDSSQDQKSSLKISLGYDNDGFLVRADYILGVVTDSSSVNIDPSTDIRYDHDTLTPLYHEIRRSCFICDERVIIGKTVLREFTFPGGYGNRGPILNYPEISSFYWGSSVRMPKKGTLEIRAYLINYWHLTTPPPITYDDPEEIQRYEIYLAKWRARRPLRPKKVSTRKPFLTFKPL